MVRSSFWKHNIIKICNWSNFDLNSTFSIALHANIRDDKILQNSSKIKFLCTCLIIMKDIPLKKPVSINFELCGQMDEFGMPYSHLTPWLTVRAAGQSRVEDQWGPRWSSSPSSSSSQLPMPFPDLMWASSSSTSFCCFWEIKANLGSTQLQPLDGSPGFLFFHRMSDDLQKKGSSGGYVWRWWSFLHYNINMVFLMAFVAKTEIRMAPLTWRRWACSTRMPLNLETGQK